jgi:hypothetical protein
MLKRQLVKKLRGLLYISKVHIPSLKNILRQISPFLLILNHFLPVSKCIFQDSEPYSINTCSCVHTTPHKTLTPAATLSDNTNSSVGQNDVTWTKSDRVIWGLIGDGELFSA